MNPNKSEVRFLSCCHVDVDSRIVLREIVAQSDLRAPLHQEFRVITRLACMGSRPLKSAHEIFEGPHDENQRLMHADRPSPSRTNTPSLMSSHSDGGGVSVDMETYGTV